MSSVHSSPASSAHTLDSLPQDQLMPLLAAFAHDVARANSADQQLLSDFVSAVAAPELSLPPPVAYTRTADVYDCEWDSCHASFASLDALCVHLNDTHLVATMAPFHCLWRSCDRNPACPDHNPAVAGRAFPKRNKLVMHCRTHTGERPFKCDECGRTFARADGLASHRKRHETTTSASARRSLSGPLRGDAAAGTGVFACQVCSRRYASYNAARRHELQAHPGETQAAPMPSASLLPSVHSLMMDPFTPPSQPPVQSWWWMDEHEIRSFVADVPGAEALLGMSSSSLEVVHGSTSTSSDDFLTPASYLGAWQ